MMTPEQKAAIAAQLGADLSKLDNDQLIELCVLYRAQPSAHDTFPDALAREITRRFTPAVIKLEGVFYGVLQHFANQFQSAIPRFHAALLEMAGTVNRDIWFTDHEALFRSAIDNDEVAAWLVAKAQEDILNKCLRNRIALGYLAQSQTTATAILANETACALWKDSPDLWQVWPQHRTGMAVVAKSAELTQYIIDTPAALAAVAASQTAMTAVAASQTAMTAVALSSVALAEIVQTATARTALITHNDNLQAVRQQIYNTVKTSWNRKVNVHSGGSSGPGAEQALTNPIKSPENALVFACLGNYSGHPNGIHQLKHPDGSIAARNPPGRTQATSMVAVDGISFGGASIYVDRNFGYSYVELWTKE